MCGTKNTAAEKNIGPILHSMWSENGKSEWSGNSPSPSNSRLPMPEADEPIRRPRRTSSVRVILFARSYSTIFSGERACGNGLVTDMQRDHGHPVDNM